MVRLAVVREQIEEIEQARLERLEQAPAARPNAMVHLLARIIGVGIETADMLVREVLSRNLRDRRAVARYAGLTGSPDESGSKRREKGLARAGNVVANGHDRRGAGGCGAAADCLSGLAAEEYTVSKLVALLR